MKKLLCALSVLVIFLALGTVSASAAVNGTVRVGLRYGSGALTSANLENTQSGGYDLGYYDGGRSFVPLGHIAQTAVTKLYGKESLITPAPLMGSEDFSWFGKDGIPYIYGFVASHNKDWDYMYGNHHEKYDVDETILHRGAAVAAQFAADYLAETAQQ